MANRFWVGGTGNWDASDTTHWAATSGGAGGQSVPTSADTVTLDANSGGGTITVTATANMSTFSMGAFTGTLNTNNQTFNCTGFNFSGSGTRTLTLGSSTINCTSLTGSSTNLTFNPNTSTIAVAGGSSGSIFRGGGLTYNIVTFTCTSTNVLGITGANTFATLTITGAATKLQGFEFDNNQIITGTLTINGNSSVNRLLIRGSTNTIGTARTLTAATVTITNADFQDITGAGAGSWNLSAISGGSGDCGGNSGITFTTPATQTWTNTSGGTWSTAANWTSRVPLPQDNVSFACAFTTSRTVTIDMPRMGKDVDFTGATWTTSLTLATGMASGIFGSLTLITSLTLSGTNIITFFGRSTHTIDTKSITIPYGLNFSCPGATYTLQGNLVSNNTSTGIVLLTGTLTANNFNVTVPKFGFSSSTLSKTLNLGSGTWTLTGTGTIWTVHNTVINASTGTIKITDTSNSAITFGDIAGSSKTYNLVWFDRGASTGSNTINGSNTYNEFKDTGTAAHSILFTTGITSTFGAFTVSGTAGNLITINSTTTGTHTLSAPSKNNADPISCDYLNIQHSIVSQANTWYAGVNSVNNQAVATAGSGWIFTAPAIVASDTSSFFQLF